MLVEAFVAALIAPVFGAARGRAALAAAGASALTHPLVWYGAFALYRALGALTVPLLEACTMAAESAAYRALAMGRWRHALAASVIANGVSWGLGALIQGLL